MKLLVDMNLSPAWVAIFQEAGWEAVHWSEVGQPSDRDEVILTWAREHSYIVFTHDLDFGAILAATKASAPSVLQLRGEDISPNGSSALVMEALRRFETVLQSGALVSIDPRGQRARVLPITPSIS